MPEFSSLDNVLRGGYCIGCGACTVVPGSPFRIEMNADGCYEATVNGHGADPVVLEAVSRVCPFSAQARDEDTLSKAHFEEVATYNPYLGYYRAVYAGYVVEGDFRARGSSGGFGKWILYELLRRDLVDAVVQVMEHPPNEKNGALYTFTVMQRPEEVLQGSRSVYYPVEMSQALAYIRANPGRYAITGIPCFMKAVRLLQEQEPVFAERIRFGIGIICGHLKSTRYADMIAWQLGVSPGELAAIDFRAKLPGTTAKQKGVVVASRRPEAAVEGPEIAQNLFGTDYNYGFFQYKACDFCDDVVGETADISVGDAWLPEYIPDGRGTSLIIPRNPLLQELLETAASEGRVHLEPITVEQAVASQIGGFRQRREGLAYRLNLADEAGVWRPPKRVKPSARHISRRRKAIYRMRTSLAEHSHEVFKQALAADDFEVFRREMGALLDQYRWLYRPTFWQRIRKGIARRWNRWGKGLLKRWG
jgi:coenzyme F420-reducing hydrogenase beta subunit